MHEGLYTVDGCVAQRRIAQDAFSAMAGIDLGSCDSHSVHDEMLISALLHYNDGAGGSVLIECGQKLAFELTSRVMSVPAPDFLDNDVRDVIGELANIIGGNLKALMPPDTRISMPEVLNGPEGRLFLSSEKRLSRICLACDIGCCSVSLLDK